ncbi:MAG TPA: gluconate 2-dehydrogenase subunit 3 family protein [Sphingomonadales bacterium]|nr:gluconate 2-dehydrogenase subunit 3 family protein [Sphingomonadales bacterium]
MIDNIIDRRKFLQKSGMTISVGLASANGFLTPAEAAGLGIPLQILSKKEATTLRSFGEAIVPGSDKEGLVHFIDNQLAQDPNDCMLLLKYFQIRPPYIDFYRSGCIALFKYCQAHYGQEFEYLSKAEKDEVIKALIRGRTEGWQGPPAFLFYMFVRSDAVDVVYGTPEGFEKLDIPYMAHILPPGGMAT